MLWTRQSNRDREYPPVSRSVCQSIGQVFNMRLSRSDERSISINSRNNVMIDSLDQLDFQPFSFPFLSSGDKRSRNSRIKQRCSQRPFSGVCISGCTGKILERIKYLPPIHLVSLFHASHSGRHRLYCSSQCVCTERLWSGGIKWLLELEAIARSRKSGLPRGLWTARHRPRRQIWPPWGLWGGTFQILAHTRN